MAGNSERRGAKRSPGSKKGAVVGSGGQRRRQLEGKGPTPRAEDRPAHPKGRRSGAPARGGSAGRSARSGSGTAGPVTGGRSAPRGRAPKDAPEVVAGRNAVLEALRSGVPAKALYVAERIDSDDRVREALLVAADRAVPLLEAPRPLLDRLSGGATHQGLVLQVPAYDYAHPDDLLEAAADAGEPPLVVALDGVTDPRNLGAVVRSAAAFGAHGVLVPERRAAGVTASAWKTSAGAAARVPVARATNLVRALKAFQDAGCTVVGLDAGASVPVGDLEAADGPVVLVVGAEGRGLSRLVRETCDVIAGIPIAHAVESLNASVAAGICLYEVARRRGGGG